MATVIENFLVGIGVKGDAASFAGIKSSFSSVVSTIGKVTLAVKGAQAIFTSAVLGMANALDGLSDSAARVGTSAEELDKLNYIASQTDSSAAAVEASLLGIGRAAGNANIGMKKAADAFKRAGIDIKDSNGKIKDSTTLLYEAGAAMSKLSKTEQLSLAQKLGIDTTMIGTITGDLSNLAKEYETFSRIAGGSLEDAAQASSDLMDEVGKMKTFSTMLTRSIMTEFIFKLKDGLINLRGWMLENADKIKKVIQAILSALQRAGAAISSIFRRMGILLQKAIDWWESLGDVSKDAIAVLGGLVAAIWAVNKAFSLGPIGLFITALTALFILYDDFATFVEGGESLFNWGPYVDNINEVLDAISALWAEVIKFVTWMAENTDFSFIFDSAKQVLKGVVDIFKGIGQALRGIFSGDENAITAGLQKIVNGIRGLFLGLVDFFVGQGKIIANAILYAFGVDISPAVDAIGNAFKIVINVVGDVVSAILDFMQGLTNVIRGIFTDDWGAIFTGLGVMIGAVFNGIKALFTGFLSQIENAVVFIGKLFGVDLTGIFTSLKSMFSNVFGSIGGFVDGAIEKFKGFLGWAEKGINAVKRFFGFGPDEETPSIPEPVYGAEDGGYNERSGLAIKDSGRAGVLGMGDMSEFRTTTPMTHGAATMTNNDNSSVSQSNEYNIRNEFNITGSTDPNETANRVEMKQRDVARNMTSVVAPMPKHRSQQRGDTGGSR